MSRFPAVDPPSSSPSSSASPTESIGDLLPLLLDQLPFGLVAFDPAGRLLLANAWLWEFYHPVGIDPATGQMDMDWGLISHTDGKPVQAGTLPIERCMLSGQAVEAEEFLYHAEGGDKYITASAVPVLGPDGAVRAYAATTSDLTGLRQAVFQLGEIQRQLDTHLRELGRVHSLIGRLSSRVQLPELLDDALDVVGELNDADAVLIFLADPQDGQPVIAASRGLDEQELDMVAALQSADLVTTRRAMNGLSSAVFDVTLEPGLTADFRAFAERAGLASLHTMPLRSSDGETLGAVASMFRRPRMPTAHQKQILDTCCRIIAQLIVNARGRARDHDIASTLQRSMLQVRLPEVPGAEVAACYRAGSADLQAGGDWYEAAVGTDGRLRLTIGDAVGHGIDAVCSMGQLRSVLRAYTLPSNAEPPDGTGTRSPVELLGMLDRWAEATGLGESSTVCTVVVDPVLRTCELSSAGHPPPLLVNGSSAGFVHREALGAPLGLFSYAGEPGAVRFTVPPGSVLLLYTDGLVERRGESIGDGLGRLAAAAARELGMVQDGDLEAACRRLMDECAPAVDSADDVALLAFRAPR